MRRWTRLVPPVRGLRALDLLNLFIADVQTGFGAFLAVYLTSHEWTAVQIGLVLSIGTITTIVSQIPAGILVDSLRSKRAAVAGGMGAITVSALLLALLPSLLPVAVAEILHGFASCALTPAVAAVSLRLVGHAQLGERLGRNARFAAIGNGTAAALMGVLGTYVSTQSVFLLTAALAAPGLFALCRIGPVPARPADAAQQGDSQQGDGQQGDGQQGVREHAIDQDGTGRRGIDWHGLGELLGDRRLIAFCACVMMFHLANAALLPIAAGTITAKAGAYASLIIAACIMLPQCVVALLSPTVGRYAGLRGRRAVLLLGWSALPARAALFALLPTPGLIVVAQVLDGVSAAVFGVMLPLIAADLTRGKGRFNLCIGIFGLATGIGASLSTSLAGWIADLSSDRIAFVALMGVGLAGVALLAAVMPETAPPAHPVPASARSPVIRTRAHAPALVTSLRPASRVTVRSPGLRAPYRRGYARPVRGGCGWR